jgi:nucleoside-diphosphate-sugar epimerase
MKQKNIAIFGSTGHIGKNLISFFIKNNDFKIFLFSRDIKKFESLKMIFSDTMSFNTYDDFGKNEYDVIINCAGISNPNAFEKNSRSIFDIAEFYDTMVLDYLKNFPTTLYINLSSGAVFSGKFDKPVDDSSTYKFDVNGINKGEMYSISKMYLESKHRSLPDLNIVDLRIFGFFSRFIDVNAGFFMSELLQALKNKSEFVTDKKDFVRDYVNPKDFYDLTKNCIANKKINDVFDVYSKEIISKFQILEECFNKFDLKFKLVEKIESISPTGVKKNYYSLSRKAEKINYSPQFSSLETILNESSLFLENSHISFGQNKPKKL